MGATFRVNSPPVVLETVDEETIIVNLESGSYYDLNHSGGRVLEALGGGADADAATSSLATAYGVEPDSVAESVQELIRQLLEEGILAESGPGENGAANGSTPASPPPGRAFEDPALSKYTDMQELLLLDPVHEVDGAGWPNKV